MTTRELRQKCMDSILSHMYCMPLKTSTLYKSITKFITSILKKEEDVEYILFIFSSMNDELNKEYYINKLMDMNQYARLNYIKAVIEGMLTSKRSTYKQSQLRFVESESDGDFEDYDRVLKMAETCDYNTVDISRFLDEIS